MYISVDSWFSCLVSLPLLFIFITTIHDCPLLDCITYYYQLCLSTTKRD